MTEANARYVKRLVNEGQKTDDFFRGLSHDAWSVQIYTAGAGWTTQEVLCHIVNAELAFHDLLNDILRGGQGAPEDMDLDAHNEQQIHDLGCDDPLVTLEAFAQARATTLEIVGTMSAEDFKKQGRHPFLGITTLDKMVQLIYRHVMIHQRDIRRVLDNGKPADAAE